MVGGPRLGDGARWGTFKFSDTVPGRLIFLTCHESLFPPPPLILSLTYPNTLRMLKNKKQLFPFKTGLLETWRCADGAAEGEHAR